MILYHGTTESALRAILDEGEIRPRYEDPGRWEEFPAHPEMIYLTNAYAIYFATCHAEDDDRGVVLEIEVDEANLRPDEDFMEQATRGQDGVTKNMDLREATAYWKATIDQNGHLAELSLEYLGTVAHHGEIGIERILRVAYINEPVQMTMMFDPTISIMNYSIMGEYYRQSMKWLFDGEPVVGITGREMPLRKPEWAEIITLRDRSAA